MQGRGWGWVAVALTIAFAASGCGLLRSGPPPIKQGVQIGVASWYGPGFHGNRTANGEIYDQYELTAAHPTLPLGTRVMVTNLANGRAVEVRINDRGPFVDNRVIDLSYAAAHTVRMIGPGTAQVRVEVLGMAARTPQVALNKPSSPTAPRLVPPAVNDLPRTNYLVEVAALSDASKAEHLRQNLLRRFPDAYIDRLAGTSGQYFRVRIGPYPLRTTALERAERVTRIGYPAILVEEPLP